LDIFKWTEEGIPGHNLYNEVEIGVFRRSEGHLRGIAGWQRQIK